MKYHKVQGRGASLKCYYALAFLAPNRAFKWGIAPQGFLELQAVKLNTSRFFTIYLTKTDFQIWQPVTPKFLVIEKCSIPHLKALIDGFLEPESQWHGSTLQYLVPCPCTDVSYGKLGMCICLFEHTLAVKKRDKKSPFWQSCNIVYNCSTWRILAWWRTGEKARINTLAHDNEGQFDIDITLFLDLSQNTFDGFDFRFLHLF